MVVSVLLAAGAGTCFSQTNANETLRQIDAQRREAELAVERARIRSLEFDADMARMRAETDRINANTERLRAATERMGTELEARAVADRAAQAVARQEKIASAAAKKNEEELDELRDEIARADVRTKNNFYLAGLVAVFIAFGAFVVKIGRRGVSMKNNEKFGLVTVIVSFLLMLLSLVVSDKWVYNQDILSNLMISLKIQLLANVHLFSYDPSAYNPSDDFLIDFQTKYLVFVCISLAAYGVTTYLGITPTPWIKTIKKQQESAIPSSESEKKGES